MVFDLLSLGSKLRVWSSASPFHPPVVLRFQRVPMAITGGDGEEQPRAHSAGLERWLQMLRQQDQQANGKRDGSTSRLRFSEATLEAWFRQQEEDLEVRNEATGDQNMTKRPATSTTHPKRNPRRRARQLQKPNGRNQSLESQERVKYCEWCRSKPIQEIASGAMSSMCEGCSSAHKLVVMFQCFLAACFDPLAPPPGLETPSHYQFQWHWNNGWLSM